MDYDFDSRVAKSKARNFGWGDLSKYLQERIPENTPVYVLEVGKWVRVGKFQIILLEQASDIDNAYLRVMARLDNNLTNWLVLPLSKLLDRGKWIMQWQECPDTDVFVDVWYIGDGSGGIVLAAETK
jgi:hypothetical protein